MDTALGLSLLESPSLIAKPGRQQAPEKPGMRRAKETGKKRGTRWKSPRIGGNKLDPCR